MQSGVGRRVFSRYARLFSGAAQVAGLLPLAVRQFLWNLTNPFGGKVACSVRYVILRSACKNVGNNVYIGENVKILNYHNLAIGENVSIHANCYIDAAGGCQIGKDVSIAHGSSIITFDHTWGNPDLPIKYNPPRLAPVAIENDCWIGCGVRILAGVHVGRRSIIAAGAVVTSDVSPGLIVGGVPARTIRPINPAGMHQVYE